MSGSIMPAEISIHGFACIRCDHSVLHMRTSIMLLYLLVTVYLLCVFSLLSVILEMSFAIKKIVVKYRK